MKKSATGLSEGKDYSTGYRFVYFDIDLPGDPVGLRAKAQETSINEWVITTFYGPYKERDSSGSYYESGPSESFSGPIAGARALVKRKAKEMAQNIPPRTAKVAFGETRAPTQVNTLSLQECPVCGEEGSFDASGRCRVCAFVPPPEPFRAPDLDLAQKVDIGDGWVNTDLYRAQPFQPEPEEDPTDDGPAAHVGGRALSTQAQGRGNGQRIAPEEINDMANAATLVRQAAERQLQRKADLDNPAQPVSEPAPQAATQTDEEAVKPDAKEEVTSPGGELPNAEPEATVDVTQPGQVTPEPTPDDVTDPTVPVAGAGEVNAEQNKVTPDVDGSGGDMTNAFQEGWTARQRQAMQRREARLKARIFASLRLASMRIENGLTQGDLITEAQRIEESGESDEAIRTQMTTIAAMAKARPVVASRPAAQRAIPSLASGRAPQVAVPPNVGLSVDQDEINW